MCVRENLAQGNEVDRKLVVGNNPRAEVSRFGVLFGLTLTLLRRTKTPHVPTFPVFWPK